MENPIKKLAELDMREIEHKTVAELRGLCKLAELRVDGGKAELVKRLVTVRMGRSGRYVQGLTKCQVCSEPIRIVNTKKQPIESGKILVVRQVRCTGRHEHRYNLKEVITAPQKPAEEPDKLAEDKD